MEVAYIRIEKARFHVKSSSESHMSKTEITFGATFGCSLNVILVLLLVEKP